jgi:hypothetical protein
MTQPHITQHAIDRYITRVDPGASRDQARRAIARILTHGQSRSTPRHWMRQRVRLTPGLRFIYWADQSGVCAMVLDGAVITIVTRALYRRSRFTVIPGGMAEPIYAASPVTNAPLFAHVREDAA